jgi:hypothetical protein
MDYRYPIEQLARDTRTSFQMGFAGMTMHLMPELEDVVSSHPSEIEEVDWMLVRQVVRDRIPTRRS